MFYHVKIACYHLVKDKVTINLNIFGPHMKDKVSRNKDSISKSTNNISNIINTS